MRVVLTGGGSGGHIYPALAIARGLMAENPHHRILYIGTRHGLEHDLVPRAGIPFRTIHARGLLVRGWRGKIAGAGALAAGIRDAWSILRRERPDVVVGTGGYVSGPVGLVASWLRIPLVIQEQNAFPGFTNRTLARRAYAVVTPWEEARQYFPAHTRVVLAGNPVQVTTTHTRESAREALGLDPKIRLLMVTGGSQGAQALNTWVTELLPELQQASDWGVIWATGSRYYETVKNAVAPVIQHLPPSRFRMEPYFYEIQTVYRAADLFVGRAGAMTIADCQAFGVPAVLVPSPHVSENHQAKNASAIQTRGAGLAIEEGQLVGQTGTILSLLRDTARLSTMQAAMQALYDPHAVDRILATINQAAGRRRS